MKIIDFILDYDLDLAIQNINCKFANFDIPVKKGITIDYSKGN